MVKALEKRNIEMTHFAFDSQEGPDLPIITRTQEFKASRLLLDKLRE